MPLLALEQEARHHEDRAYLDGLSNLFSCRGSERLFEGVELLSEVLEAAGRKMGLT